MVAILSLAAALALSATLALSSLTGGPPVGCVNVVACDKVLQSRWAYVGPVPVSVIGVLVYATILASLFRRSPKREVPSFWRVHGYRLLCGAAVWVITGFIIVQVAVLRSVCTACMAAHATALVGVGTILFRGGGSRCRAGAFGWGLVIAAGFAALQVILPQPSRAVERALPAPPVVSRAAPAPTREISLHGGRFVFRAGELPGFGAVAAENSMLNLIDFACDHCRGHVRTLRRSGVTLAPQLYFAILPVPLNHRCNSHFPRPELPDFGNCDYARLALALWRAAPERYGELVDWLSLESSPPASLRRERFPEARAHAAALIGNDRLTAALADPWIEQMLETLVGLYGHHLALTGRNEVPQIVFRDTLRFGDLPDEKALRRFFEKHLPVAQSPTRATRGGGELPR